MILQVGRSPNAIKMLAVTSLTALGFALGPFGSTRTRCNSKTDIRMMPHGRAYETPQVDLSSEHLLLPKEPFLGAHPANIVGEIMLQELEDKEETRTQLFLKPDGTISHGETDGPPPAGFCGVWQCGSENFQMTLSRAYSTASHVLEAGQRGQMKDDITYKVVRTFVGSVTHRDSGVGMVNGRIDMIKESDAAQWRGASATSIASFDPFSNIEEPAIGYFVIDCVSADSDDSLVDHNKVWHGKRRDDSGQEVVAQKPHGGKGFGGGEATRDPEPTIIDPNDPKGKQQAIHKAESFAEYLAKRA